MRQKKAAQAKWLLSDEVWKEIEPLLPRRKPGVKAGRGRPPISDRQAMNGIFFVLKTGCQGRALDVTGIWPGSTAHDRLQKWRKAGVFRECWKKGLQKYDEGKGVDWEGQSLDASFAKAPVAGAKKNRQKPHRSRQNRHHTLHSDRSSGHPALDRRR
jgi:transposase